MQDFRKWDIRIIDGIRRAYKSRLVFGLNGLNFVVDKQVYLL